LAILAASSASAFSFAKIASSLAISSLLALSLRALASASSASFYS